VDQKEINRLIKELEKSGYKVKKDVVTVKKTFEVEEETGEIIGFSLELAYYKNKSNRI